MVIWRRPDPLWVKLNMDSFSRGNPGEAAGDGVLRDLQGRILIDFHNYFGVGMNMEAKARGL
ncbi:hypothetical protein ACT9SR_13410, partial [Enterococcus faecalis]|uniref:hypothetical protein n=1 Tax=Enterococcus faecalis TaxID=1351 RepID=UPI00403909A3